MAATIQPTTPMEPVGPGDAEFGSAHALRQVWDIIKLILTPIASLKLTIVLFSLSIFLIFVGTTAQDDLDMHDVLKRYFRPLVAMVDFNDLLPKAFFPAVPELQFRVPMPGGKPFVVDSFPFPGGKSIGLLLVLNLLAAHLVRFTVQGRGLRLWIGVGVIAAGMLVTVAVIVSGMSKDGMQHSAWLSGDVIWLLFQIGLAGLEVASILGFVLVKRQRALQRWSMLAVAVLLGAVLAWLVLMGDKAQLEDAYMRILWLLMKGAFAGLVLLTGCVLVFGKRGGVVLLHGGVGLMMLGEVIVALRAVEGQMSITEGDTVSYVQHIHLAELAVIDPSDPRHDNVLAIPESLFLPRASTDSGSRVEHRSLPFDLQVVRYYKNSSRVRRLRPGETALATAGLGVTHTVDEAVPTSGTDMDSSVNLASAWVSVFAKGSKTALGTYLLTMQLTGPEEVALGDKKYDLYLRFKRTYKPYSIKLLDVRKEDYVGTSTPKDYRSIVRLEDSRGNVREEHPIWMNNPMRYAGETFYQSGYFKDPRTQQETTTLSVVSNDGWMIPYVSCALVAVGMLFHFAGVLWRFLTRLSSDPARYGGETTRPMLTGKTMSSGKPMPPTNGVDVLSIFGWLLALFVVFLAGMFLLSRAWVPGATGGQATKVEEGGKKIKITESGVGEIKLEITETRNGRDRNDTYEAKNAEELQKKHPAAHKLYTQHSKYHGDLYRFGKLPVAHDGRVKPFDTLARNALRVISDSETVVDLHGNKQPAIRWLLDVISQRPEANDYEVFRIDHPELQERLGLPRRKGLRYSVNELQDKIARLEELASKAEDVPADKLTTFQRRVAELERRLQQFIAVSRPFQPYNLPPLPTDEREAMTVLRGVAQVVGKEAAELRAVQKPTIPRAVPVAEPVKELLQMPWEPYSIASAWQAYHKPLHLPDNPAADHLTAVLTAYRLGNNADFNKAVADYEKFLKEQPPQEYSARRAGFEAFFNHFQPFLWSSWLYFGAILLTFMGWLLAVVGGGKPLHRAAFWLILFTLVVHTAALIGRIYISGRPPVTNLYSSAVFIGWGAVIFGLVLELIFDLAIGKKLGVGNLVASVFGFATLLISHFLAADGDTFAVLQAVLDTQIWLATHVVCVTMGYSATFVAGKLGIAYICCGLFTPALSPKLNRVLTTMIYGVLCFAIFFSFVGTVLGGLWADDSWGRFWGWDPKENGALIIVIWTALVLHARWDGMVKDRGLAVLAVAGMITTTWSWFGVNELGIGLHSYGFTEGTKMWIGIFCVIFLLFIALGSLPREWWWSFRRHEPPVLPKPGGA